MNDYVILVDEQDNPLELADKMDAHKKGLLHRAFSVFVVQQRNDGWYTLLQRRSLHKYHCAGLWTNTCCSHPHKDETIEHAGHRRLAEEMGIKLPCIKIGEFIYKAELENGLIEHEYDHVLISYAADDLNFNVNPEEVMDYQWCSFAQLVKYETEQLGNFTPWFFKASKLMMRHLKAL